jgi:glycosyltransferase 2 family protein
MPAVRDGLGNRSRQPEDEDADNPGAQDGDHDHQDRSHLLSTVGSTFGRYPSFRHDKTRTWHGVKGWREARREPAPAACQAAGRRVSSRRTLHVGVLVGSLLASALFAYLAVRNVDWSGTADALRKSNYWWLAPALAALAISVAIRVERWRILFRRDQRPSFAALTKAMLVGQFFNIVLPARAGEAARAVALKSYAGTPAAESGATIIVERLIDVLSLLALLFISVPWLPTVTWLRAAAVAALIAVVAAIALVAVVMYLGKGATQRVVRALAGVPLVSERSAERALANILHGLAAIRRPRQGAAALGWTAVSWLILGAGFWFLMIGFHLHLPLLAGLLAVVAVGLTFVVPAAPGGAGVFEAAGLAATSAYGVPTSRALAYVLVLHALNVLPFVAAGAVVLVSQAPHTRRGMGTVSGDGRL